MYRKAMLTAFMNGLIGSGIVLAIGMECLGFALPVALQCILASNIAALTSLLATLQLERMPKVREKWLGRSVKTWSLLMLLYFGILLALGPEELRNLRALGYLVLPLILATGFCILAFGPIQDYLVRAHQRKSRN